jgi:hypothetical protein
MDANTDVRATMMRVCAITWAAENMHLLGLRPLKKGSPVPAFAAGAHVDLHLPNPPTWVIRSCGLNLSGLFKSKECRGRRELLQDRERLSEKGGKAGQTERRHDRRSSDYGLLAPEQSGRA